MTPGRLIAVVGASGVGKDSVMAGIHAAVPDIYLVRRVITRVPGLAGENYDAVSVPQFDALVADGAFAVHWQAHRLAYGIPVSVHTKLNSGGDCLANFSRAALPDAARVFARLTVLNITAQPDSRAGRLAARRRETQAEIAKRLAAADKPLPPGLDVIHLSNDGPLPDTIARAVSLLYPTQPSEETQTPRPSSRVSQKSEGTT